MDISVLPVSADEKEILRNLLELYSYDCSGFDNSDVNDLGLYGYKYLDHYWTEADRYAYFIRVEGKLAGFIMVDAYKYYMDADTKYAVSEFFILQKYRRKGAGRYAVKYIMNKFGGKWQLGYNPNNNAGKKFWNSVIREITGGKFETVSNSQTHRYEDGMYSEVLVFDAGAVTRPDSTA